MSSVAITVSKAEVSQAVAAITAAPARRAIKQSFWYQWRSVISSLSIFGFWGVSLGTVPVIAEDTLAAWIFNAAGWTLFTSGLAIRLWATLYIGGRKAKGLIDSGPYSICRNPLYWGTLMVLMAAVVLSKSLTFAFGAIIPIFVYMWGVVPAEEAYLSERLGDVYLAYCRRVPRWWPQFSQYATPSEITINVRGLRAECLRILGWIGLPFFLQAVCVLRAQSWWFAPFNLP